MKFLPHLALLISVSALSNPVLSDSKPAGRELAKVMFETADKTGRGFVDQGDMERVRKGVFAAMDVNKSNRITEDEWLSYDSGFKELATVENKELTYRTALRVVFSFHDRNGDGSISQNEHQRSVSAY